MDEANEENIHQDGSTTQSASERKRTFSDSEQEPTEPAEKTPRVANSSEDDQLECGICNEVITTQIVGQPENCQHKFCLSCLIQSAKRKNKCPLDGQKFNKILLPNAGKPNVEDFVNVSVEVIEDDNENIVEENVNAEEEAYVCEFCDDNDSVEMVYDCFNCESLFHLSCLTPPLPEAPLLEGKSCCLKCFQRVCYVCGGRPGLVDSIESCIRCEKDFHPNCHAPTAGYGKQVLCPSCYLEPETPGAWGGPPWLAPRNV